MKIIGVLPASGKGSRIRELTGTMSKELLEIRDRPLLFHALVELLKARISTAFVTVSAGKEDIPRYLASIAHAGNPEEGFRINLEDEEIEVRVIVQSLANGSGGAVREVLRHTGICDIAVLFPDVYIQEPASLNVMMGYYRKSGLSSIMVGPIGREETDRYGLTIKPDNAGDYYPVLRIDEKPSTPPPEDFDGIIGRYIINVADLKNLHEIEKNRKGEYDLTEMLCNLPETMACVVSSAHYECGSSQSYLGAKRSLE